MTAIFYLLDMTTLMRMQGHNNDNEDEAPQTGRMANADAVKPWLKSYDQPLQLPRDGRRGDNMTMDDGETVAANNKTTIIQSMGEGEGRWWQQRVTQQTIASTDRHNNQQTMEVNRWGDGDDGDEQG
jgi:hypothetical protein